MASPPISRRWDDRARTAGRGGVRYGEALERLGGCQKPARGAPLYSQFVNRPLGRRLAAAAAVAGLSPDGVSVCSFAASASGIIVLAAAPPSSVSGAVAAGLLVFGYALDAADGQLARLRGGGSVRGEWLDHVLDAVKIPGLHLAVAVSALRSDRDLGAWTTAAALLFALVATVSFFQLILTEQIRRRSGLAPKGRRVFEGWRRLLSLPTDWGVHCLWFLTWGAPTLFLWGYGTLAAASAGHLAVSSVARFRELGDAGATGRAP